MREFFDMITDYVWSKSDAARQDAIAERIWRRYGADKVVLVVDLSGFSKRAETPEGLLDFLGVVRRMQTAARPIMSRHEGEVVKMEADNCFVAFDDADGAARAAFELIAASHAIQEFEAMDLRVCCGLEVGRILMLPEQDFFGHAVNVASRLGEDLAEPNEVLVGPAVRAALKLDGWRATDIRRKDAPKGSGKLIEP